MNTKSDIQLILEDIKVKEKFENELTRILEKYDVVDTIFSISTPLYEIDKGYFVPICEYVDIHEALKNAHSSQALRVIKNKRFIIGNKYNELNDCIEEENIINIETLKELI